jgi:hypothetical protein
MGKKNYGMFPNIKTKYVGKFYVQKKTLPDGRILRLPYETFDFDGYEAKKDMAFQDLPAKEEEKGDNKDKLWELRTKVAFLGLPVRTKAELAEKLGITYNNYLQLRHDCKDYNNKFKFEVEKDEKQADDDGDDMVEPPIDMDNEGISADMS